MNRVLFPIACLVFISLKLFPNELIEIHKKGVLHKFVPTGLPVDQFARYTFSTWENDTFEVFDRVKDPEAIAIDLGAWIGTTSIWLAKNFHHVIAVEPDQVSLECLQKNLYASDCANSSICSRPIASTSRTVIFGPMGERLNESISCVKSSSDHAEDYSVRGITIKQLIHDYVFQNNSISSRHIGFIKCDIEGGEEDILEDLLHFAYHNKVKIYLSFHLDWWKSKKITDFEHLLTFFKTDCAHPNICEYISHNPFVSLLLEPKESSELFVKTQMPVVIIAYNQPTFIKNMVRQLEPYTSDIIVIDNNSNSSSLLDFYENDFKYTLLRQKANFGSTVYQKDCIQKLVGDVYVLTDPDLAFNENLPHDFIQKLLDISNHLGAAKVGFALSIDHPDIRTDVLFQDKTIQSWEAVYWRSRIPYDQDSHLEVYHALIDTTFCLINKKNSQTGHSYRIGGDFTCLHLPWLKNFELMLEDGEYENYLQHNISTSWFSSSK